MNDSEIIEALAVKVLGWRQVKFPALVTEAVDDGIVRFIVNSEGQIETRIRRDGAWGNWQYFSPLTNPADSKMVREKLAERFTYYSLDWLRTSDGEPGFCFNVHGEKEEIFRSEFEATEERAVALCALQSVAHNGSSAA